MTVLAKISIIGFIFIVGFGLSVHRLSVYFIDFVADKYKQICNWFFSIVVDFLVNLIGEDDL